MIRASALLVLWGTACSPAVPHAKDLLKQGRGFFTQEAFDSPVRDLEATLQRVGHPLRMCGTQHWHVASGFSSGDIQRIEWMTDDRGQVQSLVVYPTREALQRPYLLRELAKVKAQVPFGILMREVTGAALPADCRPPERSALYYSADYAPEIRLLTEGKERRLALWWRPKNSPGRAITKALSTLRLGPDAAISVIGGAWLADDVKAKYQQEGRGAAARYLAQLEEVLGPLEDGRSVFTEFDLAAQAQSQDHAKHDEVVRQSFDRARAIQSGPLLQRMAASLELGRMAKQHPDWFAAHLRAVPADVELLRRFHAPLRQELTTASAGALASGRIATAAALETLALRPWLDSDPPVIASPRPARERAIALIASLGGVQRGAARWWRSLAAAPVELGLSQDELSAEIARVPAAPVAVEPALPDGLLVATIRPDKNFKHIPGTFTTYQVENSQAIAEWQRAVARTRVSLEGARRNPSQLRQQVLPPAPPPSSPSADWGYHQEQRNVGDANHPVWVTVPVRNLPSGGPAASAPAPAPQRPRTATVAEMIAEQLAELERNPPPATRTLRDEGVFYPIEWQTWTGEITRRVSVRTGALRGAYVQTGSPDDQRRLRLEAVPRIGVSHEDHWTTEAAERAAIVARMDAALASPTQLELEAVQEGFVESYLAASQGRWSSEERAAEEAELRLLVGLPRGRRLFEPAPAREGLPPPIPMATGSAP